MGMKTSKRGQIGIWGASLLLAGLATMALAAPAFAKTYNVNKAGDHAPNGCTHSDCTLREAVLAADGSLGVSDVVVLPNFKRPYKLSITNAAPSGEDGSQTGDLDVTNDPLRIIHRGRGRATIDADGIDRVLQAFAPLVLSKIRVTGGATPATEYAPGGGIDASANLKVLDSVVSGNLSRGGSGGGGIFSEGSANVTVVHSILRGNRTFLNGGGLQGESTGYVRIERSSIIGNSTRFGNGGGVGLRSGNLDISGSTVSGNRADRSGGGIAIYTPTLIGGLVNTTITQNRAGDSGGGVFVVDYGATFNGVTIARNVADSNAARPGPPTR
jgi:hypothetical protein